MLMRELKKELMDVLDEIEAWRGTKKLVPKYEVRRREIVLWKQAIIYKIIDSKRSRNLKIEAFNTELLYCINSFLS
jgi:hypothetical protein